MTRHRFILLVFTIQLLILSPGTGDYIRSDEITLEDNLEADAQIINLNRLMENNNNNSNNNEAIRQGAAVEKIGSSYSSTASSTRSSGGNSGYVFRLVNDTSLVNYIDLRYLDDEMSTAVIILKKRLNYEDICEESSSSSGSGPQLTCQQTLKIVAINENDFIEIPIEIKKVMRAPRKIRAKCAFDRERLEIKPSALASSHLIDYPRVQLLQPPQLQRDLDELVASLDFSLSDLSSSRFDSPVQVRLEKKLVGARKLKLHVQFASESELLRAYETKNRFRYRLVVFLSPNMTRRFEIVNETSHSMSIEIGISVDDLNVLNLRPLDFEYPIYSVSIENNAQNPLEVNDTVLEPKLKSDPTKTSNNSIVFSLFLNNDDETSSSNAFSSSLDFPFYVDDRTGVIRLKKSLASIFDETTTTTSNTEKLFNFGIKATYRNLADHRRMSSKSGSYYSYMLPAYAKIQISLRSSSFMPQLLAGKDLLGGPPRPHVSVRSEILSPFVSRYEILNEDSNNQTLILFINDPFSVNSKLIKLHVQKMIQPKRRQKPFNSTLYWQMDNYDSFFYDDKSTNLTLLNRVEFKDQSTYRTSAKLRERLSSQADRVLAEVNIQFRVDFDPLLFEQAEYVVHVRPRTLVNRPLVRIRLKSRLRSILNNNKHDNVTYRLATINQQQQQHHQHAMPPVFEIGMFDGWLRARRELDAPANALGEFFDLEVIAVNLDLQKSASVKCRVYVSCEINSPKPASNQMDETNSPIRFNIFDNSPNRTQIGIFKSICSDVDTYSYRLEPNRAQLKLCNSDNNNNNDDDSSCQIVDLVHTGSVSNLTSLFTLNPNDGYLMTNGPVSTQSLLSLVPTAATGALKTVKQISVMLAASIPNLEATYAIEIAVQSVPRLDNFADRLVLIGRDDDSSDNNDGGGDESEDNRCIFTYRFSAGHDSIISRFVRIDKLSSTHLEPEFRFDSAAPSCLSAGSFYIYNNGCMTVKWTLPLDDSFDSAVSSRRCQVIKAGEYKIEFKLCFYDANKVSCSPLYNQSLIVDQDLHRSNKIRALAAQSSGDALERLEHLQQRHNTNGNNDDESDSNQYANHLAAFFSKSKRNGFSIYLLALLLITCAIASIALVSFLFLFLRRGRSSSPKKGAGCDSKKKLSSHHEDDKILVLPNSKDLKNLEISTESTPSSASSSGSRTGNCSNTPETSSNAATTSSKVSKIEDENDEIVKIQVVDDYLTKDLLTSQQPQLHQIYHHQNPNFSHHQMKYSYSTNNFNYGGSFSSIGSSSCESSGNNGNANGLVVPPTQSSNQGLYSVKTASIQHFNHNAMVATHQHQNYHHHHNQQHANDFDLFQAQPIQAAVAAAATAAVKTSNNSLKKLKKDLALKKHTSFTPTIATSLQSNSPSLLNSNENALVYDYMGKEVLLNPANVIASVV